MTATVRIAASRRQTGIAELGIVIVLYALYEVFRGFGDASLSVARDHASDIVALERVFNVFVEGAIQDWAAGVPGLPTLLGAFYVVSHLGLTALTLVWLHRRHPERFPLVRNTLVVATALSLVGYILYPAAPPRLSGHGFVDTVSAHAHVNLSSDLLGSLYNPFAAVPSLHFGYALLVGITIAVLARGRVARAFGWSYPIVMLFVIVATGNHFFFDAAAGGLAIAAGYAAASWVDSPARRVRRWQPARESAAALS